MNNKIDPSAASKDNVGHPTSDLGPDIKEELEHKAKENISMSGIILDFKDLNDIYLTHADLSHSSLVRTDLSHAHMFGANLQGANLFKANLYRANLNHVDLRDCNLLGVRLEKTKLDNVIWNKHHVLINERKADEADRAGDPLTAMKKYREAEEVYRSIKLCYQRHGENKQGRYFFYREMVCHRKQLPLFSKERLISIFFDISTGYGEKPMHVIYLMLINIMIAAALYGLTGINTGNNIISFWNFTSSNFLSGIGHLIYFSTVVYTTLGFGDIIPVGIGKGLVVLQALSGVIITPFLIVSLYKTMMLR